MNNWTLFFIILGAFSATAQLFKMFDWAEGKKT